jgi:hypothetical protein
MLNCLHRAGGASLPVAFKVVRKIARYTDAKTGVEKRKSAQTSRLGEPGEMRATLQAA